jgi:HSP20 family protein
MVNLAVNHLDCQFLGGFSMPSHEMQPYEHEESSFWPADWPFIRGFMPSMRGFFPSSNISVWEEKDRVMVEAPLPGIKAGDVELTFEKGVLTIRAQKKEEKEDKERKYFHKSDASYVYRLSVPGDINESSEPEAKLENGIIHICFKKQNTTRPRKINVKGS